MREFSPRSPEPGGDFENPRGHGVLPEGIFKIPEQAMGIWLKIPDQKPEFRIYFFIAQYNFTQCFACKTTYSANFTLKCNMHSSIHNLNHLRFLNLILKRFHSAFFIKILLQIWHIQKENITTTYTIYYTHDYARFLLLSRILPII